MGEKFLIKKKTYHIPTKSIYDAVSKTKYMRRPGTGRKLLKRRTFS